MGVPDHRHLGLQLQCPVELPQHRLTAEALFRKLPCRLPQPLTQSGITQQLPQRCRKASPILWLHPNSRQLRQLPKLAARR